MKQYIKARLSSIQSLSIKTCQKLRSINPIYQIIIGVALLAIIIASKFLFGHRHSPESKVVEIYKASKGNMLQTTRLLGRIEASKLFTSTAGYEGTISYIAPAGSTLKAGEIIAKIQNDPIEAAYHSSIHTVEIATAQYNRQLMLFNSKTASRQTVEDKFSNLSVAKRTSCCPN